MWLYIYNSTGFNIISGRRYWWGKLVYSKKTTNRIPLVSHKVESNMQIYIYNRHGWISNSHLWWLNIIFLAYLHVNPTIVRSRSRPLSSDNEWSFFLIWSLRIYTCSNEIKCQYVHLFLESYMVYFNATRYLVYLIYIAHLSQFFKTWFIIYNHNPKCSLTLPQRTDKIYKIKSYRVDFIGGR